jgi:hypothetical protein
MLVPMVQAEHSRSALAHQARVIQVHSQSVLVPQLTVLVEPYQ